MDKGHSRSVTLSVLGSEIGRLSCCREWKGVTFLVSTVKLRERVDGEALIEE